MGNDDDLQISDHDWLEPPSPVSGFEFTSSTLHPAHEVEPPPALVVDALRLILESSSFLPSKRGSQFLHFVVQYRLQNHSEPLKERTIGAALFNRPVDYSTGDDSVVRAQAREVRRRLERYYAEHPGDNPVHIDLPVGSYTPRFRWTVPQRGEDAFQNSISLPTAPLHIDPPASGFSTTKLIHRGLSVAAAAIAACLLLLWVGLRSFHTTATDSVTTQFWAPAFASSKPLLICLPKPILYRPSPELYKRHAEHPGEFDREIDRMTHPPHLKPDDMIRWGDMNEFFDYGVGKGDVEAAIGLSRFLGQQGKDSEVRIGNGYSSEDLRKAPAVIVGAFSNPLAIEMTAALHFAFVDDNQGIRIQEQGATGKSWRPNHGAIGEDYGLVTRLVDSTTGQFVVLVAGVEGSGSDAAADLIVHPDELEKALVNLPPGWSKKNVQILVSTTVKDFVAGPPKVVAVYSW